MRTPYLEPLADVPIEISPEPRVPDGWEAVVSSAYPDVPGCGAGSSCASSSPRGRSIAVAGSHGKGTTAALIAFALRETGRDPAWLIGAPVPQLGSNAGFGGGYLVVEADESDRTAFALAPAIAVVTNLELDHHAEFASAAELEGEFDDWLAGIPHVVRDAPPFDGELAFPGAHNRRTQARRWRRSSSPASRATRRRPSLARFTGTGRRFEVHESGGHGRRRLRPPSERGRGRDRRGARALPRTPLRVLFQPHLYSRTRHLAPEFAAALAAADDVTVTDVYPAREAPVPGVTGKLDRRRAVRPGRARRLDADGRAGRRPPRPARAGRGRAARVGAGDVDRAVGLRLT